MNNILISKFITDAKLSASKSFANKLKVGCVVIVAGERVCDGRNGTIRGYDNNAGETIVDGVIVTDQDMMVHAEQNAISYAARRGISINGGTIIGTHSPCLKCCSLIIQCGITEMIFNEKHHSFEKVEDTYGKYINLKHWNH